MSQDLRRELISRNLGIKPINHGLVYSFQIAIPESKKQSIPLERQQALETSLVTQGSNLSSLIIRRTNTYDDEDIEYELVHGADWLQVAQELEIEKVWAWVFDLTDEQAIATAEAMEKLSGVPGGGPTPVTASKGTDVDIEALIEKKLQLATNSIKTTISHALKEIKEGFDDKLKTLTYQTNNLTESFDSTRLKEIGETLDYIESLLTGGKLKEPINLPEASDQDIEAALKKVKTNGPQIEVAIKTVSKWKNSEQGLTWENIERSSKGSKKSPDKVPGFGKTTYQNLWRVASIPNDPQD
ncbi:MAG: hypothetical protein WBA10_03245 [Elainellaceae cyanobacterium]